MLRSIVIPNLVFSTKYLDPNEFEYWVEESSKSMEQEQSLVQTKVKIQELRDEIKDMGANHDKELNKLKDQIKKDEDSIKNSTNKLKILTESLEMIKIENDKLKVRNEKKYQSIKELGIQKSPPGIGKGLKIIIKSQECNLALNCEIESYIINDY